jgi:hypothetical protein
MEKYTGEESGVVLYEIGEDYIICSFADDPAKYLYSYKKPGKKHVEAMKPLARRNKGLTTYINQHVRKNYEKKF